MSGKASPKKPVSPVKQTKSQQRAAAVADAARTAAMVDSIRKEERAQVKWLQRQAETDPELAAACSTASIGLDSSPTLAQHAEPPELYQTLRDQSLARPDKGATQDISQALSLSINPGYFLRDPQSVKSQSKDDFIIDEEELEYMRAHGMLDSRHHRKQNDISRYVEALARSRLVIKAQNAATGKATTGAAAAATT